MGAQKCFCSHEQTVEVAKAFSAPIALLCLAQVPGHPLDLEGAWGPVLGALCPLRGTGGAFDAFMLLGEETWLLCDVSVPW